MLHNATLSENLAVLATIDPQTVTSAAAATSDAIDMGDVSKLIAVVSLGDIPAGAVVASLLPCDSDGSNTGAALATTTLTASADANDNTQIVLELSNEAMAGNSQQYVLVSLSIDDATGGPASCLVLGEPWMKPASDSNLASVTVV